MTRTEALALVARLAHGLSPDMAGVARLLERISEHDEAEMLRAVLTERGAEALIDSMSPADKFHKMDPTCRRSFSR